MKFLTTTLARVLLAIPFGVIGLMHFLQPNQMVQLVPDYFPQPMIWLYSVGALLILASVLIMSNRLVKAACLGLAAYIVVLIFTVHVPGLMGEGMDQAMNSLLKDTGLIGGCLLLAGQQRRGTLVR